MRWERRTWPATLGRGIVCGAIAGAVLGFLIELPDDSTSEYRGIVWPAAVIGAATGTVVSALVALIWCWIASRTNWGRLRLQLTASGLTAVLIEGVGSLVVGQILNSRTGWLIVTAGAGTALLVSRFAGWQRTRGLSRPGDRQAEPYARRPAG